MKPFDKLVSCLHKGEISRRDFMQKAAAMGLAAAVPGALLSSEAHAAAKRGGHLRVATVQGSSTDQLDPTQLPTSVSVSRPLFSSTVITPSLPTFCIAPAICSPISASPLAEIVPT